MADRPAQLLRSYTVDGATGALNPLTTASIAGPAFVVFAELGG